MNIKGFIKNHFPKAKYCKLGIGENNLNYLIKADKKYVLRIPYRKDKYLINEFNKLKALPKDFGPKPILLDKSKKYFSKAVSVLEYVKGKSIHKWSHKHLKLHAEKIKKLHSHKRKKGTINIIRLLKEESSGFDNIEKENIELNKKFMNFAKKNNHLFKNITLSLVHSDPCCSNILFNNGEIHYIDWEWTKVYDPARDIAMFFFEHINLYPWKIKLNGERLDYFYKCYGANRNFKKRVKVWQILFLYNEYLYFIWKLRNFDKEPHAFPKSFYKNCLKKMKSYIDYLEKSSII